MDYSTGLTVTRANLPPHNCSFVQDHWWFYSYKLHINDSKKKTHNIFFPGGKWNLGTCRLKKPQTHQIKQKQYI